MKKVTRLVRSFIADERGLETVEYAVIAALITLAAIGTIGAVGVLVNAKFEDLRLNMGGAAATP